MYRVKGILQSTQFSVIFNVILTLILVAEMLPQIWPDAPEWLGLACVVVVGVGNIILKVWFTSE